MLQGVEVLYELGARLAAFLESHAFGGMSYAVGKSLPYFTPHHPLVELQATKKAHTLGNRDRKRGNSGIASENGNFVSSKE